MSTDEHTPRRSLRVPDSEWDAASAAASHNGETLTAVIRRELVRYAQASDAPTAALVEYRATPKDERFAAVVGITGPLEAVRVTYPSRHWILEERTVSGYRPARASGSGRATNVVEQHRTARILAAQVAVAASEKTGEPVPADVRALAASREALTPR